MKDSQLMACLVGKGYKYIKESNERFSTETAKAERNF